jgi:hypothetical protein
MQRNEKGYITLLLLVLIAFGFLLSGGLMALLDQTPASTSRYVLVEPSPFPPHQTLQLATLNLIFSAPPVACDPGNSGGNEPNIYYASQPGSNETVPTGGTIKVWYTDEQAMSLGKNPGVSAWQANMTLQNPSVGDTAAKDGIFPYYPALFLTDITSDPTSRAGDVQNGGIAHPPSMVYGAWKAQGEGNPSGYTQDTLPAGADQFSSIPSANLNTNTGERGTETGFQAELLWNVSSLGLTPGHSYRAQFVIHDGDRDGDIGLGCTTIVLSP